MEPFEAGSETESESEPPPAPASARMYHPGAFAREGMAYRITIRTVLWVILLSVLLAFMVWWVVT